MMKRTYYFEIDTFHLSWQYDDLYYMRMPVAVELDDEEIRKLAEAYMRYYSDEFKDKRRHIDDEEYILSHFVPDIHKKVRVAIEEQLPIYYGEKIREELNRVDIYLPSEIGLISINDPTLNHLFVCDESDSTYLIECSPLLAEGELTIPVHIKKIKGDAFYGCSRMTKLILPENAEYIGKLRFCDCYNLKEVQLPDNIIECPAFANCISLKTIKIPTYSKELSSFENCFRLTQIVVPSSVVAIGALTFLCCRGLKKLTILPAECDIDPCAFSNCNALEEIHMNIRHLDNIEDIFGDVDKKNCKLYVPDCMIEEYNQHPYFKDLIIIGTKEFT